MLAEDHEIWLLSWLPGQPRRYEMTAAGLALVHTDRAELDW